MSEPNQTGRLLRQPAQGLVQPPGAQRLRRTTAGRRHGADDRDRLAALQRRHPGAGLSGAGAGRAAGDARGRRRRPGLAGIQLRSVGRAEECHRLAVAHDAAAVRRRSRSRSSAPQGAALGSARAQYQLRQILVFLDGRPVNKPEVMIAQAQNHFADGKLTDEVAGKLLADLGASLALAVRQAKEQRQPSSNARPYWARHLQALRSWGVMEPAGWRSRPLHGQIKPPSSGRARAARPCPARGRGCGAGEGTAFNRRAGQGGRRRPRAGKRRRDHAVLQEHLHRLGGAHRPAAALLHRRQVGVRSAGLP